MKKYLIIGLLLGASSSYGVSQYYQKLWKTTQLGPSAVLVTCLNGADPTGNKITDKDNNSLIISCAIQNKAK